MMHSLQGQKDTFPVTWLLAPDEKDKIALLEYGRSVLYSLSTSGDGRVKAVHVSQIRGAFEKLGKAPLYRLALRLLILFREVESLPGGYWLIAPFRVIDLEDQYLLVGAIPSHQASLGLVTHEALARFIEKEVASAFPKQTLESWLGLTQSTTYLVSTFRKHHQSKAAPTIIPPNIEYFKISNNSFHLGRRFYWDRKPHAILKTEKICICRVKLHGHYNYFSSHLQQGNIITEAKIEQPLIRLMYALSSSCGSSVPVTIKENSCSIEVSVPERLPIEDYRIALLLSNRIERRGNLTNYSIAPIYAPVFLNRLTRLGCSLETAP